MASNNFINECKTPAYEDRLGKIVIDGIEYNQANNLTNFEIENSIYNNGTIIGNTYTKSLKFSLINVDKDTEFVSKIANPSVGVKYDNNTTEYIDFDDYTIESLNDEQTKNFTDITGYDSLNTMDKIYVCGLSEGPHTVGEYWQDLLDNLGLETETSSFTNSDIVIPANPFVNNESNSVVLGEIEKVSCNFSRIEKRTRTVNNQEETYHVINLMWFNDDKGETATIDGGGVINNVDRLDKMKLIGNTVQNGTPTPESPVEVKTVTGRQVVSVCGKNFFNYNTNELYTTTQNGSYLLNSGIDTTYIDISKQDNGYYVNSYNNSGYRWYSVKVNLPKNTNFKLLYGQNNLIGTDPFKIYGYNNLSVSSRGTLISNLVSGGTFNTGDYEYYLLCFYPYQQGKYVKDIQIVNANTTDTSFEEYKGNDYEINLGKNLVKSARVDSATAIYNVTLFVEADLQPSTTYTFSFNGTNGNRIYANENLFNTAPYITTTNDRVVITLTTKDTLSKSDYRQYNSSYQKWVIFKNGKNEDSANVFDNLQLEKGSQATSYSPYKTPIYLGKIGNYKDYIFRNTTENPLYDSNLEEGQWYIHKEIGKVVLNGSETNWNNSTANYYIPINDIKLGSTGYSNYFVNSTTLGTFGYFRVPTTQHWLIFMAVSSQYTYQQWKDWLSTHNVEVYYQLDTPTNTLIEDNELISQLNDIRLISGTSHINLSGDVTPTLEVNYFDNTPNYEFTTSDYSDLEGSLTEYGPVNCVTLGSEDIGGENVFLQDEASIEENGETNVLINAEYFLYTQTLRQQAIGAIYNKLLGFRYYDLSLTTFYGKPFLQVGDKIRVNTNEGNVYDTYILKHTFTYDGTFKSVIESPSFTKQEEIVKSTESISSKIKRTEVMVDKANGQITSLTTRTDNLEQNTYTKTQTNELIQTAQTGLTNTFSEAGGNNIFRNTGLWFATSDSNNPYEFWEGVVLKRKEEKASNMSALLLQNNNLIQEQLVPNGSYTISFKYNRMIQLAVAKVYINDVEYSLSGVEETEFIQIVQVNSQHINIRFTCDRDSGFEIYDLMVNAGEVKLAYSQNQNETTTDTVNISKGITITSSDIDVTFKANADGIRTIDKNSNVLTQFTDTGMTTKRAVIEEKSEIVGTLWQEVGEQTWITKL